MLRLREVRTITGASRSTIYALEAAGKFPRRVKLGMRAVAWIESEVQAWIAERVASSREG